MPWMRGQQTQVDPAPPEEHETMTLPAKVEQLRIHLGMEGALPINAVVTNAVAELGLDAEVQGMNLRQKIDVCFAALDTFGHLPSPGPELAEVVHPAIVPMGEVVDEAILAANARALAAEQRAQRAEAGATLGG